MRSQVLETWKNEELKNLLNLNQIYLGSALILEIDKLITKIAVPHFIHDQQITVLLNYIYADFKNGNLSEINQYLFEIKAHLLRAENRKEK